MTQSMRLMLVLLAILSLPCSVHADGLRLRLDVVDLHAPTPGDDASKGGILFTEEPFRIRLVEVVPAPHKANGVTGNTVQLLLKSAAVRSEVLLSGDLDRSSKVGGSSQAVLEFAPLAAGDYEVVAIDEASRMELSRPVSFVVRHGDETEDVRRVWLRLAAKKARSSRSSADPMGDYRKLMLELAALEPKNPSIWEELADSSIDAVPPEKTIHLYRKAYEIAKQNVEARLAEGDDRERVMARFDAYADQVLTYERHHEEYLRRRSEVTMHIFRDGQGGKRYALLDKSSGRIVRWLE